MVEVDPPMKAPSMHIQKPYEGKFSELSFCQKKNSEPNSSMHMFNVSTLYRKCSICFHCIGNVQCVYIVWEMFQIVPSKAVVGVDRPVYGL